MSRVIEIVISPKGETTMRTRGFSGATCRQASAFLEQALGQRTSETLTPEYHRQEQQQQCTSQQ